MGQIIYMEQTLLLINPEEAHRLISVGEVRETEKGTKYLVLED